MSGVARKRIFPVLATWFCVALAVSTGDELRGRVVAPDGQPAAGAAVRLYYVHDAAGYGLRQLAESISDAQGRFAIASPEVEPPAVVVQGPAVMRRYLVALTPLCAPAIAEVSSSIAEEHVLNLEAGRTLTCRVVTAEGRPAPGVTVTCQREPEALVAGFGAATSPRAVALSVLERELHRAVTDERGMARFNGLPAMPLAVIAAGPGFGWGWTSVGPTRSEASIAPTASAARLWGRVSDKASGKGLPGLLVFLHLPWSSAREVSHALTGPEGEFNLVHYASRGVQRALGGTVQAVLVVADPAVRPGYATHWMPLPLAGREQEVNVSLERGQLISGTVINTRTGEPLARAVVSAFPRDDAGRRSAQYRLADGAGAFCVRATGEGLNLQVQWAPPGWVVHSTVPPKFVGAEADAGGIELNADASPEGIVRLVVRNPDGTSAARATVTAAQVVQGQSVQTERADREGRVCLGSFLPGHELPIYALSADRAFAAMTVVTPVVGAEATPVEVRLRPAYTAEVVLQDRRGQNQPGYVLLRLADRDGRPLFPVAQLRIAENTPPEARRIPGLLPGVNYMVTAQASRALVGGTVGPINWRFAEGEKNPRLVVVLERRPAGPAVLPPQRTEETFRKDLETLRDALWQKEDPVQKQLTWYVLKEGLALADAERKEVKRFTNLFDYEHLEIVGLAFAADKVWVATNKGLLAWDRRDRFWSRFAVGGLFIEVSVREVSVTPEGRLHVAIQEEGEPLRRFEYDLSTRPPRWVELP